MSDAKVPKQVLIEQIEYWEAREVEAEEQLRVVREVLPVLRQSLLRLEMKPPAAEAPSPSPAPVETEDDNGAADAADDAPGQGSLTGAEEITRGIETVFPGLPSRFTGTDVAAALDKAVNRSSLRSMLQLMAGIGKSFVVETPGRGRRATIYRKL